MQTPAWQRLLYVIAYPLSALMLIVWAIVTFAYDGPGWIHFFLSLGMFLVHALQLGITLRGLEPVVDDAEKIGRIRNKGSETLKMLFISLALMR